MNREEMTGIERVQAAKDRYYAAAHAMQTGVASTMYTSNETSAKHLRVGVNSALVDSGALASLLLNKGIITEVEYFEALAERMEAEASYYAERVSKQAGREVKLL